ncbi:hypothetical protein [Actinotalea sp. Marseille-Q4924]|nr:hypothetical protein [Actinotalea sp. Marseille-Q4924]
MTRVLLAEDDPAERVDDHGPLVGGSQDDLSEELHHPRRTIEQLTGV